MVVNFTEDKFKEWVFSLPDETIVGVSGNVCSCPIAEFLKCLGYSNVVVSSNSYLIDDQKEYLPDWAKEIVYVVDFYFWDLTKEDWSVTAKQLKEYYGGK